MSSTTQSTYSDRAIYLTLLAAAVLFVLSAPLSIYLLDEVGVIHRLWVAVLAANLVAWTGLLVAAVVRQVQRLIEAIGGAARPTESPRRDVSSGDLALEA